MVVRNNDALRTTFDLNASRPLQLVHAAADDAQLPCYDLGGAGIDAAYDRAAELAAEPIAIDSLPVRAFIGLRSGQPSYLGFAIHHAAADHTGCLSIDEQLQTVLRGDAVAPAGQPIALALDQQRKQRQHDQTVEFWAKRWGGFTVEDRTGADTSPRYRAHLYSKAGMRAAAAVSTGLGVSLHSVVLAVTGLVVSRLLGRRELTMGLVAGNRLDPQWAGTVTSMFQTTPVLMTVDPALPPTTFLRETSIGSYEAYLHGQYDIDRMQARLAVDGVAQPSFIFDNYFSFLGETGDDVPDDHPRSQAVEVSALPVRVGPRLQFRIATGPGMHIQMRASAQYVPAERLGIAAASIEAGLISLADQQPSRVDEICLDPIRTVIVA
jgi:hypothetical protein